MGIICLKNAENFVILSVYDHGKFFLDGIKVIIYAYALMIIEYYDFKNDI